MSRSPVMSGLVPLLSLLCAYLSDRVAERKGVRHAGYAALGSLLGPLGLLIALARRPFGLGPKEQSNRPKAAHAAGDDTDRR